MSKYWKIKQDEPIANHPAIVEAAHFIKQNEVVAFPTETVYGLGANAFSDEGVQKIFQAKGRPGDNPLIIHIANQKQISDLVSALPEKGRQLLEVFAPGPITLILKGNGKVSPFATAGLDSIGVRIPDHPIARELIAQAGVPIAAPSANLSGRPSPTRGEHVWEDLKGRIAGVLDGGETGVGVESTVLDLTVSPPMILRPGGISREEIESVIGNVDIDPALEQGKKEDISKDTIGKPRSPGMKYTHYAPQAPLWLVNSGSEVEQYRRIIQEVEKIQQARELGEVAKRIGILTTVEGLEVYGQQFGSKKDIVVIPCGTRQDMNSIAHNLYDVLRKFDHEKVEIIFAETFVTGGMGAAIMNRLNKAAGGKILY